MIDRRNYFDEQVKNDLWKNCDVRKMAIGWGND